MYKEEGFYEDRRTGCVDSAILIRAYQVEITLNDV